MVYLSEVVHCDALLFFYVEGLFCSQICSRTGMIMFVKTNKKIKTYLHTCIIHWWAESTQSAVKDVEDKKQPFSADLGLDLDNDGSGMLCNFNHDG